MTQTFQLGDISLTVTQKNVKNVHLSVHPPDGRVTLVMPTTTRLDVARAYAISKLSWIREQQRQGAEAARPLLPGGGPFVEGDQLLQSLAGRLAQLKRLGARAVAQGGQQVGRQVEGGAYGGLRHRGYSEGCCTGENGAARGLLHFSLGFS